MSGIELNTYDLSIEELMVLMPNHFYKYATIDDNLKSSIAKGELWYNSPTNFNDPFDCKAHINYGVTEEECRANFNKFNRAFDIALPKLNQKVWNALLRNPEDFNLANSYSAASNFEKWLGVTCFSENFNNTLMWAHYCNCHRGCVLEFRKDPKGFLTKNMLPVNYYEDFPIINLSDYTEEQMISVAYQVICAKGNDWEYENEWRAIAVPGNSLHSYNKNELTGIIFGLNTIDQDKKELYNLVTTSGYTSVNFREAQFKAKQYIVEYVDYKP